MGISPVAKVELMTKMILTESSTTGLALDEDGTIPIVLITPGQGSSGYYSEDVIKRDCAEAWPKNTHSYINHIKRGETRDPEKMIGVLTEDAHWDEEKHAAVSRLKPFKHWAPFVEEIAPYAGLSISAAGTGNEGEVDGKTTVIVESIAPDLINSVDLVSYAGRGGHFSESAQTLYDEALDTNSQPGSASGKNKKDEYDMATVEERLDALTNKLDSLVTVVEGIKPAPAEEPTTPTVAQIAEAIKAVEDADIPASSKKAIYESIESGEINVKPMIESAVELRKEILEEAKALEESLGATAGGANSADLYEVKGWS